jgi:sulfoxide reductase catalytic subunit YedY
MRGLKEPSGSEITPPELYATRRQFLKKAGLFTATAAAWGGGLVALSSRGKADPPPKPPDPFQNVAKGSPFDASEPPTDFGAITTYNNFYELGLSKAAPAKLAGKMKLKPWAVRFTGEIEKPVTVDVEQLVKWFGLEERIYRMRCVEAWSMVIPWVGFPLAKLIKRLNPTSRAKWIEMRTLVDTEQLPGQEEDVLDWPYTEGLRMDEAMNPLSFLAVGIYGAPLLGQNGAPMRLVVPWKYGFKGVKSIVEIELKAAQPINTWSAAAPSEYGFYANVNPQVPHPRWSQATERRIGRSGRIATAMYNGYGEHVAPLYVGMDLKRYF